MTKRILAIIGVFALSGLNAGVPPPPPPAGGPGCWPPPCIPIDNGVIFLMVAGTLYAVKKLYDFKKQKALQ
jgi:hypothetical protein